MWQKTKLEEIYGQEDGVRWYPVDLMSRETVILEMTSTLNPGPSVSSTPCIPDFSPANASLGFSIICPIQAQGPETVDRYSCLEHA
jgi:hypothetical protein